MYYLVVRQFARTLKNLDAVLEKAQAHAKARKFDPNNYLTERMYPDMLPFVTQVRIACDNAKSAASLLSGKDAPVHEDNEKTFEELRGRIGKCLAYLDTFTEQRLREARRRSRSSSWRASPARGCTPTSTCSRGRSRTSTSTSRPRTTCCAGAAWRSARATTSAS